MSEDGLPEVLFRARLYRKEKDTPWGFRLQGGVEFNKPLTLLKVIPDSVAAKVGLNAGDILVRLAGRSADSMTHREAQQAIVNSGNSLEIIVERADVTFSSSSSACILGSTFSDKGQLTINDLNSETYTDEKDDLKAAGGGGGGGGGGSLRRRTSEEEVDSIIESFSDKILNEIPTTTTTTVTTKENDVSVRRISTSSASSAAATPQVLQLDQQHPSTSSESTTAIPDSPTTTTTTTNNADVPPPTPDRVQAQLSPGSLVPAPVTHGGREPGQSNGDAVKDTRQADGRLDTENDGSVVGAIAVEKGGEGVDEKMTPDERLKMTVDERLNLTDERLNLTDERLKMTTDDRLKMTIDDRLKMTIDDRLKMTTDDRLKMTIDDRLKMTSAATTVATVLTDHNDNIPLDHLEEQNSFPVRALLKTSALTSELGDESSDGADDQSSEFSDDVSVIEVQTEGTTTREEVAGVVDEDDEEDTLPDTDALFYQDETEYREISLLNFDDRFFEAASAAGAARSSTPSAADPDPEGDMNRMKACFYLPSLVPPDSRVEPATTAVTVQSLTVPVVTSEVWGTAADKSPRDFSQTAPWRVSSGKTTTTTTAQTVPPRRAEDLSPTTPQSSSTQQMTWDEARAHPIVSSYILNDPGHSGPENVIYIPISIFGAQLKLGSQYTFQRKDPVVAPSTPSQQQAPVGASSPTVASPPMSLTLMGRRSEDRHAQRVVVEQPPPPVAVVDQPPPVVVVRASDPGQTTHTVSVAISTASSAVTMATARVYIAPVMSPSSSGKPVVSVPAASEAATLPVAAQASPPSSSSLSEPPRRLSNELLSDLQDIPLPPVRDIVADLNSRLEKVAERYETSAAASAASASAHQVPPSTELGTSFARPERRRSSSGSDSEKEIIIDTPPFSQYSTTVRLRERLLGDQVPPPPPAPVDSSTYRSVIYRGNLSPKSIRRFSLPGGAMTVKDSVQRRVRFAEPPESSVIEIEGRQRRWPTGERIRSAGGDRIIRMRDDADAMAAEAEYVSVSSLAEKLDRIELENALASAAMKRSRPFQVPPQVSVSSLLATHPADIRASSPGRGSSGLVGRPTAWKLEPIQERVINIQTLQPPDVRMVDDRQIRIGSQKSPPSAAAVSAGSPSVRCTSDLGGGFSVSIGPGSGGQLSLSVQQHHPNYPNHGGNRHGHSPTRVNFVLPSSELGKPDQFSYSVSAGGVVAREPLKYTLPPTYEESVRAMASGKHPRSSSLDDAKQMSMAAAAAAAAYPPRISELRAESQMASGTYPPQPGLRIMRAQSPTLSHGSSSSHPGWVISSVPPGAQERDPRRGYSQTLQVDTGSRQLSRSSPQPLQPPPPSSPSYALPVYHARSGALSSADLVGYHHHHHQETSPQQQHQQQQDRLMRMMAQQQQQQQQPPPHHHPGMRQAVSGEIPRQDIAARFYRSGSPLILSPPTGFSNSGSAKSAQGTVRSFSPVSSPSGADRRWPPSHRFPDHLGQAPSPLTERRQWPTTTSSPRPMTPTVAQQPFVHEQPRQVAQPSMATRPFPEAAAAAAAVAAGALAAQRLPGIFALLDKTFTDKVMQWEGGGGSRSSGGLQQSETYKLVREMDDAMKQDKQ